MLPGLRGPCDRGGRPDRRQISRISGAAVETPKNETRLPHPIWGTVRVKQQTNINQVKKQ